MATAKIGEHLFFKLHSDTKAKRYFQVVYSGTFVFSHTYTNPIHLQLPPFKYTHRLLSYDEPHPRDERHTPPFPIH